MDGDIVLYNIESKNLKTIKGVQKYEQNQIDLVSLHLNDDASVIIMRSKD